MTTHKCSCGEKGYEGIFSAVYWKCPKCGKYNKFKAPKEKATEAKPIEAVPHRAGG